MKLISTGLLCFFLSLAIPSLAQSAAPRNIAYNQFDWNKAYQSQSFSSYNQQNSKDLSLVEGSPYYNTVFLPGEVFYRDTIAKPFYIRHNAFMDEIEVKEDLESEMFKSLLKDSKISVIIAGEKMRYIPFFKDRYDQTRNGYMFEVYDGVKYDILHRKTKEFREGVTAMTSFQSSFPDKFEDRSEYYISIDGKEPAYIKLSRKGILSIIEKDKRAALKDYMKANDLDPDNQDELIRMMNYIETEL